VRLRRKSSSGSGGRGKGHLGQAIGQAAIQQGYRVLYRETQVLLNELAEAIPEGTRKECEFPAAVRDAKRATLIR